MKQLNTAMMEYAADYNDRLPPASHWRDLISEHWSPHHQESHELNTICCPMNRSKPSYAMNQALSGFRTKLIEQPQDVVLLFDATGSSLNLSGGPNSLRVRHRDHATVGFADGSAKSLEMGHLGTLRRLPTMSK